MKNLSSKKSSKELPQEVAEDYLRKVMGVSEEELVALRKEHGKKPPMPKIIPMMSFVSKVTGQTVDEIYEWNEEDWLAFAKKLREVEPKKKGA